MKAEEARKLTYETCLPIAQEYLTNNSIEHLLKEMGGKMKEGFYHCKFSFKMGHFKEAALEIILKYYENELALLGYKTERSENIRSTGGAYYEPTKFIDLLVSWY
jgi:hypothetical protein